MLNITWILRDGAKRYQTWHAGEKLVLNCPWEEIVGLQVEADGPEMGSITGFFQGDYQSAMEFVGWISEHERETYNRLRAEYERMKPASAISVLVRTLRDCFDVADKESERTGSPKVLEGRRAELWAAVRALDQVWRAKFEAEEAAAAGAAIRMESVLQPRACRHERLDYPEGICRDCGAPIVWMENPNPGRNPGRAI